MFGFPLAGPSNEFYDNNGAAKNTSIPESILSKKYNTVNQHCAHEASAAEIMCVRKEDTATNLAEPLTKFLPYS